MPLSAAQLMEYEIPSVRQTLTAKDAILYALSVGYGTKPQDPDHLHALYERELRPVPTLANLIAHPGPWMQRAGVSWTQLVHAEQRLVLHRDIPIGVQLESQSRMRSVKDRGAGNGMFASFERVIRDGSSGESIATIVQTNFCGGDGGCGSAGVLPQALPRVPDRGPDGTLDLDLPVSAAALYRLNGDFNALHIDPAAAAAAGFDRPILHGLCTFGHAAYAISRLTSMASGYALRSMSARFTAPIFPGETLGTQMWRNASNIQFRCRSVQRDTIVLDCGVAYHDWPAQPVT